MSIGWKRRRRGEKTLSRSIRKKKGQRETGRKEDSAGVSGHAPAAGEPSVTAASVMHGKKGDFEREESRKYFFFLPPRAGREMRSRTEGATKADISSLLRRAR